MVTILFSRGKELDFVLSVLKEHYEFKDRGRWGSGENNKKEVDLLGRKIRWHEWGLTWEGDEHHRKMVIDFFGMDENSTKWTKNGYKDDDVKDATDSRHSGVQVVQDVGSKVEFHCSGQSCDTVLRQRNLPEHGSP